MLNSFNSAMKKRFGCKIYKLSLSGGMTCPTRDGTLGTRGCIFCSAKGSGDFAAEPCEDIAEQIKNAKALVAAKAKDAKYCYECAPKLGKKPYQIYSADGKKIISIFTKQKNSKGFRYLLRFV